MIKGDKLKVQQKLSDTEIFRANRLLAKRLESMEPSLAQRILLLLKNDDVRKEILRRAWQRIGNRGKFSEMVKAIKPTLVDMGHEEEIAEVVSEYCKQIELDIEELQSSV